MNVNWNAVQVSLGSAMVLFIYSNNNSVTCLHKCDKEKLKTDSS